MTTRALFLSALLLAAAGAAEVPREQDAFQQLLQKVQTEPGKASEDQVKELIAAGQRLGHPYAVSLALKGYLVQAPHVSPGLLLLAAENALCAGDFRTATARCKAILDVPQGDGVAPEAAGLLCRVLVDFLGADDEAYRFLAANAEKFHQAPAVRRFDAWFLDTARRRRDWAGMARMLQLILAQGLPLEQERLHFWEHLDALMGEVVHANDDHLAALPFCRKLVPAIRDDRRRTLKYGLFVANLEFKAGSAGKEGASLDAAFEPVVAAARAYFAAYPTAATLRDIVHAFSDGGVSTYFNQAAWQRQAAAKSALFADAFGKLSDADHEAILEWRVPSGGHIVGLLASREQWAGLVVRHGDLFRRCDAARHIPLYMQGAPRELLKQQAAVVRDVPSRDAAVVNALAAVGGVSLPRERGAEPPPTSLAEAMEHLVRREAWHMAYAEPFELIEGQLWPAWRALSGAGVPPADPAGKMPAPPDTTYRQALARFGASVLARTPLALDSRAARACVEAAWDLGDAADGKDRSSKAAIIPLLDSLQWVPYSAKDRAYVFDTAHQRFRAWADWVRKEVTAKEPKATKAMADQIVPIEDAFRRVLAAKPDPAKAPDASCRALAEVLVAEEAKNQEAFLKAARTLYPLVRDSEAKRTPFGRAILTYLTRCRPQAFETIDFQAEALADQLALRVGRLVVGGGAHRQRWAPVPRARGTEPPPTGECALSSRILGEVAEACVSLTPDHGWWRAPAAYRERTLRLNALFEKALAEQLGRGQFSPQLFDWFRGTRSGEGWRDAERGEGLMAALIEKKALQQAGYRAHAAFRSATCSAQWIVRNEFPTLAARFAPERYFDDAFVEEGVFDPRYWDLGADSRRRVANAAAAFFAKLDTLPFGYGDGDAPAWSRADFWDWQSRALGADKPARDAMLARAEAAWGKSRFDTTAMGGGYFAAEAEKGPFSFSAQQPAAPQGGEKVHVPFSARKEFFTRLRPYLDKVRSAPARLGPPFFGALAKLEGKSLTKEEFDALLSIFPDCTPTTWPRGWGFEALPPLLTEAANALGRQAELFPLAPHFWKIARDTRNTQLQHDLAKAAVAFAAEAQELAVVWSQAGLDLMRAELSAEAASTLAAVRSKALAGVGGTIPVPRDDRRYPVYAAQADYLAGKTQSAWELAARNRAVLKTVVRELDPAFPLWLIGRSTELGDYDGAEDLARTMIQWFDSVSDGVPPETRARLLLAYANIAAARTDYPRARALYQRVVAAKEFEGTRAQGEAQIQIAETDRLTRRYDQAIEQLEAIARSKDPLVQAEAYYHIALVKFDQEEFREALKPLDEVFARVPDHALARILEGRTKIRIRKLEEPTELQIGTVAQRRFIVPGKPLVVNLEDRTLAALAESEAVEIRAWTDSGDEETFTLLPFADSKTKFRGHLPTALGAAAKGNGTLEVLGRDVVRYDYSAAFQKAHKTIVSSPQALEVVTEAELLVSSGVILSKEERAARALEALIKQRLEALEPTPRERPKPNVALSTVRPEDQVKPGNRINVRVVDGDQSVTAGKDKVTVSVAAASGDAIAAFPLEETGTHSGVFEGAVPTVPAQAVALASDSQDGAEPNAVIGPLAEKSPPWVGLPDGVRPKTFTIDLNDNIELGKMRIVANVPGRRLKSFVLRTSLNGRDFQTLGAWPEALKPWDGTPTLELVRFGKLNRPPAGLDEWAQYLDETWLKEGTPKFAQPVRSLEAKWTEGVGGHADAMRLAPQGEGSWFLAHYKAAFYLPARKTRTFEVATPIENPQGQSYLITVDGQAGTSPTRVRRSLGKGVHRLDVYVAATRGANAEFRVMTDTDVPPFLAPVPFEMLDPAAHPEIKAGVATAPATIAAAEDGSAFDIAFPKGTRARVVRLLLADFETDAPAIARITLDDAAGKPVLPTREDVLALRKNNVLEIVPGDRITVTYQDPKPLAEGAGQHQAFLSATFHNAEISACFVEYTQNARGERTPRYIPMRRFKAGDAVQVYIADPDADVGEKQDAVPFTVRTADGRSVELKALETEEHSGVFVGAVFPVKTEPQRPSEVRVAEGDDLVLAYLDKENTDPGIPWERTALVEQAFFEPPVMRVFEVTSAPLTPEEEAAVGGASAPRVGGRGAGTPRPQDAEATEEVVPVTRSMLAAWPQQPAEPAKPTAVLLGGPLIVEVLFPFIAQSPESTATLYAQTTSGLKAHGRPPEGPFDITVPGTLRLDAQPSNAPAVPAPPGYSRVLVRDNPYAGEALDDGRFTFLIPVALGKLPDALADEEQGGRASPTLRVKGSDEIVLGVQFKSPDGKTQWATQRVRLGADAFFDAMDRRYREPLEAIAVGESAWFRVIDPLRDTSDEPDTVTLAVRTASGTTQELTLRETFSHSGAFKGVAKVAYRGDAAAAKAPGALPAAYGDKLTAIYRRPGAPEGIAISLPILKGSNGDVVPFTKQFADPQLAVQTQFSIAEAYFELAKRHRELGQEDLARDEIAQGRKLLEEAIRDFPDSEARAQADYLLADLALEFANETKDEAAKKKHYMEAVTGYTDIVAAYPDSLYAPRAQYKKALAYEKMGLLDHACEEYVKLSYRYPDSELVAEAIARLGRYFLSKGEEIQAKAADLADPVAREKLAVQAREMNKTAGQVLARLAVRFPAHRLAGPTLVLSGQCYVRAEEFPKAAEVFKQVAATPNVEPELAAEAMYWCGDAYTKQRDYMSAYRMFKKLTWDYPASKWAKFARGRLTEDTMASLAASDNK